MNGTERYFEEFLLDPDENQKPKMIGLLVHVGNPGARVLGYAGRQKRTITAPVTLNVGANRRTYNASERKPLKVVTTMHRLEGRFD